MTDITEFLRARLDEYEHVARCVLEAEPKSSASIFTSLHAPTGTVEMSPARVLAQVAAIRAIVDAAQEYSPELEHGDNGEWAFEVTLRHLAAIWRDHDDYDPAWAPEGE